MSGTSRLADGAAVAVGLSQADALDPALVGAKAANLAQAARAGLPVLAGFTLTTAATGDPSAASWPPDEAVEQALRQQWQQLGGPERGFVVRSSSTVEDIGASSMAGQFKSVSGVVGWPRFIEAVGEVLASAHAPGQGPAQPMAVLVQPELKPLLGGVLFGVDPVTGNEDRIVIEAVRGSPQALVSGTAAAQRIVCGRKGRVRSVDGRGPMAARRAGDGALLSTRQVRQLAALAQRTAVVFGGAQDIEWALDEAGTLWLLQSRPVTAVAEPDTTNGPVLGPGPVAETFPLPLRPLEVDLWLAPMRAGIRAALQRTRMRTAAELHSSPVLTTVGGWAAADLELLGYVPPGRRALHLVDPRPGARRLAAAWRVGQVRAQLTDRVTTLLSGTDAALADVPAPAQLDDDDLIRVVNSGMDLLAELHEAEVLSATLSARAPTSVPKIALERLAHDRRRPFSDRELIAREPVLLSLVPPRIGTDPELPQVDDELLKLPSPITDPGPRDLLRLRARWVQELLGLCATEAGRRLRQRGLLADQEDAAWLTWAEVRSALGGESIRPQQPKKHEPGPPLPAHFRLDAHGAAISVERPGPRGPGGVGAGGGRAFGVVVHEAARVRAGDVLVTRTLDPRLSVVLPRLAAIVSESGSTLSHLAILAREYNVPAVVAVHGALSRFPAGSRVVVDGTTGEVTVVPDPEEVPQ